MPFSLNTANSLIISTLLRPYVRILKLVFQQRKSLCSIYGTRANGFYPFKPFSLLGELFLVSSFILVFIPKPVTQKGSQLRCYYEHQIFLSFMNFIFWPPACSVHCTVPRKPACYWYEISFEQQKGASDCMSVFRAGTMLTLTSRLPGSPDHRKPTS